MKGSIGVDKNRGWFSSAIHENEIIEQGESSIGPLVIPCPSKQTALHVHRRYVFFGGFTGHASNTHACMPNSPLVPKSTLDRNSWWNSAYSHSPCLSVDIKVNFLSVSWYFGLNAVKSHSLYLRQTTRECADAALTPQTINRRRNCFLFDSHSTVPVVVVAAHDSEYHEYIVDHSTNTPPLPLLYLALHAKHPRNRKRRAAKHKSHPVLWSLPQDWKDINDGIVKG